MKAEEKKKRGKYTRGAEGIWRGGETNGSKGSKANEEEEKSKRKG